MAAPTPPADAPNKTGTLVPVAATLATLDDFDLVNMQNLVGAGDVSCSMHFVDSSLVNDWTDTAYVRFNTPYSVLTGVIDGFTYKTKGQRSTVNHANRVVIEIGLFSSSMQRAGSREDTLPELGPGGADITVAQDVPNTAVSPSNTFPGPDGITLITCGNNVVSGGNATIHPGFPNWTTNSELNKGPATRCIGTLVNTGNDFGGLTFRWRAGTDYVGAGTPAQDVFAAGLELVIYFTPGAPAGSRVIQLTPSAVAASTLATYNLSAIPNKGAVEAAWANIGEMLTLGTAIATTGIGDPTGFGMVSPPPGTGGGDVEGASAPAVFTIPAGQVGNRRRETPLELRFAWLGRVEALGDNTAAPDYAQLYDLVLTDADGVTLIDTSHRKYGGANFKVGSYNWVGQSAVNARRMERWRVGVLDISALTTNQMNDIQARGCRVVARWRMIAAQVATFGYCAVAVRQVSITLVTTRESADRNRPVRGPRFVY